MRNFEDRDRSDEEVNERTEQVEPQDGAPRKKHGDALRSGKGTRHGVDDRQERPATGSDEGLRSG